MFKVLQFFINSSTLWLITELLMASLLCFIPIFWVHALTEQTLSQGLLLATIFLVPSELYRQFKVSIDAYLAKHGESATDQLSLLAKVTVPITRRLPPDLARVYRDRHQNIPMTKQPQNVTLKLQCWKCGFEFPYVGASKSLDKSNPVVLNVTKSCPMCHATCQLTVPKDQCHLRQFKTQSPH